MRRMKWMVICTGNTCRSPMGEGILRQLLREHGHPEIAVSSAGLSALEGDAPSESAVEALDEIGIDISAHRSHRPSQAELADADRIYVMTSAHRRSLELLLPELADKIRVAGVDDPYGFPLSAYCRCRDQLMDFFRREVEELL